MASKVKLLKPLDLNSQNITGLQTSMSSSSTDGQIPSAKATYTGLSNKSKVTVSASGTATDEINYITVDGIEKKIAGGSTPTNMCTTDTEQTITANKKFSAGKTITVGERTSSDIDNGITDTVIGNDKIEISDGGAYTTITKDRVKTYQSGNYIQLNPTSMRIDYKYSSSSSSNYIDLPASPGKNGYIALTSDIPSLSGYATESWVEGKGYLTEHQSLANYSTTAQMNTAIAAYHDSTKADVSSLSSYATVTALNNGLAAKQNNITSSNKLAYSLISGTPDLSDMATKTWVGSQGYLTSHQSLAAYRTSADQDTIDAGKQATLVSGTNIKTINSNSLLGSGNISIATGTINPQTIDGATGTISCTSLLIIEVSALVSGISSDELYYFGLIYAPKVPRGVQTISGWYDVYSSPLRYGSSSYYRINAKAVKETDPITMVTTFKGFNLVLQHSSTGYDSWTDVEDGDYTLYYNIVYSN